MTRLEGGYLAVLTDTPRHAGRPLPKKPAIPLLSDLASAVGAAQEDRTGAAWATTPPAVGERDETYQYGFPLPPDPDGIPVNREHPSPYPGNAEG